MSLGSTLSLMPTESEASRLITLTRTGSPCITFDIYHACIIQIVNQHDGVTLEFTGFTFQIPVVSRNTSELRGK